MSDLAYYRSLLRVDKHTLDDVLEVQAQFQDEISRELALANTRMLALKDEMDRSTADAWQDLKAEKVSDTLAAGLAKKDPERMRRFAAYQEAREYHEQWQGLSEAWKSRGYSIKTLADLYVAQYYSIGTSTTHQVVRQDTAEYERSLLAGARKPLINNKDSADPPPVRRRLVA